MTDLAALCGDGRRRQRRQRARPPAPGLAVMAVLWAVPWCAPPFGGMPPAGTMEPARATEPARVAGPALGPRAVAAMRESSAWGQRPDSGAVVVASKPFAESYILAEAFAQLLESRGHRVQRRPGLGATEISFAALRTGAIDVYPEYTGTGLVAILGEKPESDPRAVYREVSTVFARRWGVRWLPPLGFQNTYAIAVRRETADRYHLRTLDDLARVAPGLTAGFSPDFIGRADGLPGLRRAYALRFQSVRSLLQAVKYRALAAGAVDVIDGYSTDGEIARYGLVVLDDDRGFFPAYQAAALVSARIAQRRPDIVAVLSLLSGRVDEGLMRRLNQQVEVDGEPVPRAAATLLADVGLGPGATGSPGEGAAGGRGATAAGPGTAAAGTGTAAAGTATAPGGGRGSSGGAGAATPWKPSLPRYLWDRRGSLLALTRRHLLLVALSLGAAILVAVPLGLALERARASAETAIRAVGLIQTIPGIALIAFMIPLLGIGVVPALVALFLYSLYPIVRNTYSGVRDVAPEVVDAARALGMTPLQLLWHVRLPLAAPIIMAGIRTAAVIDVGAATLAAFIGAGGLGDPIVAGLALSDTRMVLSGAVPAALLALAVDALLALAEHVVAPRGLRGAAGRMRARA
jgi:osmoprotectant transport system substrate-binding protein/osmoprotectant transport system permease protein